LRNDFPATARELATDFYANPTPERVAFSIALMEQVGQRQTLADFQACDGFDVADRLAELRIPVLAFTGAQDVMTPPAYTRFLGDRVPGAQTRIVERAGHLPMLENAEATNEVIGTFVSSLTRSAP
jgi:3-oxoadipate enol-lactonase